MTDRITTIWTNPGCQPCRLTKVRLDKAGVPYVEKALADHPEQAASFKERGLMTAPIVEPYCGTAWAGLQPDLIKGLAARYKRATEAAAEPAAA